MKRFFHRYAQGEKEKSFVPLTVRLQNGRLRIDRIAQKRHL